MTCDPRASLLIRQMFNAALEAVDPAAAVGRTIRVTDGQLTVNGRVIAVDGKLVVVAIGKGAERMAAGTVEALGERIDSGYVITKYGHANGLLDARFQVFEAGHPILDQAGVDATRTTLESLARLEHHDVVLALISGGGSALLEAPIDPVSLDDFAQLTRQLLSAGAPIQDLNAVRIPLSAVKGGRLRQACPAGRFVTLILSDVLGNDPQVVASGPTVPGTVTGNDAHDLLKQYQLSDSVSPAVQAALAANPPAHKAGGHDDDLVVFVADNSAALEAAAAGARAGGTPVEIVWRDREGEASVLGREWIVEVTGRKGPVVLLGGGEATVTVRGDGSGGRNTEFALSAALDLDTRNLSAWTIASLATDGQDALTDAAGAIACAGTVRDASASGLDPWQCLQDNDSLRVFEQSGGLVVTGPTGTNVNDLYFAVNLDLVETEPQ